MGQSARAGISRRWPDVLGMEGMTGDQQPVPGYRGRDLAELENCAVCQPNWSLSAAQEMRCGLPGSMR